MLILQVLSRSGDVVKKISLNAKGNSFSVAPNQTYQIIDADTGKVPKGIKASHKGNDLLIEGLADETTVTLNNFYTECPAGAQCYFATEDAIPDLDNITQSDGLIDAEAAAAGGIVAPNSPALLALADGSTLVHGATTGNTALEAMHGIGDFLTIGGGIATALSIASGAGGGGSSVAAAALKTLVISGSVTSGPFLAQSTTLTAYDKAGNVLGETRVDANGDYTFTLKSNYVGSVLVVATDANNTGTNYIDEASGNNVDLGGVKLRKISYIIEGPNNINTVVAHITPLSEIGAMKLGFSGDVVAKDLSAAEVAANDGAIAKLFGLSNINVKPIPINSPLYNEADGISDGEKFGRALAAFSGADNTAGGSLSNTINLVFNSVSLTGGVLSIAQSALDLLAVGIDKLETGVNGALTVSNVTLASLVNVPIIDTARDGINAGELTNTNINISTAGAAIGNVVTVNWGNQSFTHALTAGDISSGVASIVVPPSIINAAGSGNILVNTVIANLSPSGNALVAVALTGGGAPPIASLVVDNSGLVQGNVFIGGSTDDNTPSLVITAPALGNTPVLFVDGTQVASVFLPAVLGVSPATLTPVVPISAGLHQLSYAYNNIATGVTGSPSPNFNITLAPDSITVPTLPPTLGAGLAFDDSAAIPVAVLTATTDTTPALTVTVPANLVGVTGLTIDLVVNGTVVPSTASTITVAGVAVDVLTPTTPLAVSATPYNLSYQLNLNGNSVTSTALPITVGAPIPTPAVPTGVIDNVGTLLGNVLANGTTDDSTASLAITAPAVGQAAVLYVNGIETTSVFAVAAGLMPSTLTPVGDLGNGQYQLSYAYRDVATGTTGAQSPTINITVTPASTVSIDTIGAAAGTLANDVFELNTPLPLSGLTINSLLDSATTLVTGGLGIDTLAVTGTGQTLDLTLINDLRITNIEKVDLTGSGNNTLKLNLTDVLAISPTVNVFNNTNGFAAGTHDLGAIGVRNQLIVDGNVGDTLNTNGALASLTNVGNVTHQGLSYNVFQNAAGVNAIELLVNQNLTVI